MTSTSSDQVPAQAVVTARYERIARFYDVFELPWLALGRPGLRRGLLARAQGKTLEVGIGTGRNVGLYHESVELTGIDVSPAMLDRARRRAQARGVAVPLQVGDVHALSFPDDSFDTVTATCVFCSVADPVAGLREVDRVLRSDGRVLLVESVRPRSRLLGRIADVVAPAVARFGPHVNRQIEDHVAAAGLDVVELRRVGTWRAIVARPSRPPVASRPPDSAAT